MARIDSLGECFELFERRSVRKILFLTGKNVGRSETVLRLRKQFSEHFEIRIFSEFSSNPKYEELEGIVSSCEEFAPDAIVACGGGTAMDLAKLVKYFSRLSLKDFVLNRDPDLSIPILAIPTTAGTGSEVTQFAVVYRDNKKYSIDHPQLRPNDFLYVEELLLETPKLVRVSAALDSFCQAFESLWAKRANKDSVSFALQALDIHKRCMLKYCEKPSMENASQMLNAATYAGEAINITRTTAPHAASYGLTSLYGISHGTAVAMCLPFFIRFNLKDISFADTFFKKRVALLRGLFCEKNEDLEEAVLRMFSDFEIPQSVSSANKEIDIEKLVSFVNLERLGNNPCEVEGGDLRSLFDLLVKQRVS